MQTYIQHANIHEKNVCTLEKIYGHEMVGHMHLSQDIILDLDSAQLTMIYTHGHTRLVCARKPLC